MSSDSDAMPGRIIGYEKQVHTGRNSIEDFLENLKGIILGPVIWVRGNTITVYLLLTNIIFIYSTLYLLKKKVIGSSYLHLHVFCF